MHLRVVALLLLIAIPTLVAASYAEQLNFPWATLYLIIIGLIGLVILRRSNKAE